MPRIKNYCNPDRLGKPAPEPRRQVRSQGLENDIIQFCGICLDLQELKKVLGLRDDKAAKKWAEAENILPVDINGRKKWLARDVARALELSKIRA